MKKKKEKEVDNGNSTNSQNGDDSVQKSLTDKVENNTEQNSTSIVLKWNRNVNFSILEDDNVDIVENEEKNDVQMEDLTHTVSTNVEKVSADVSSDEQNVANWKIRRKLIKWSYVFDLFCIVFITLKFLYVLN